MGKERCKHPVPLTPPASWKRVSIVDPAERQKEWDAISLKQKHSAWEWCRRKQVGYEQALQRVEAGRADKRTMTLIKYGGMQKFKTREEGQQARIQRRRQAAEDLSQNTLQFQLQHARSCSVLGCAFNSTQLNLPITFFEHDHVDRNDKIASVTLMPDDESRLKELSKTQTLCCWHHYIKTRTEVNPLAAAAAATDEVVESDSITWKSFKAQTGCQHPSHSSMPYNQIVQAKDEHLLFNGFINTVYILRDTPQSGRLHRSKKLKKDEVTKCVTEVESGKTRLFCRFCHVLHIVCEKGMMYKTSLSQHQFGLIKTEFPGFVEHFNLITKDVDWDEQRSKIAENITNGLKRKFRSNRV